MSKTLSFVLGLIMGVLISVVGMFLIELNPEDTSQKVYLDKPGKCIVTENLHVIQVIDSHSALAISDSVDLLVLVENPKGEYYFDGQEIKCPKGYCFRQVGVYHYLTANDYSKTVPIVRISKK